MEFRSSDISNMENTLCSVFDGFDPIESTTGVLPMPVALSDDDDWDEDDDDWDEDDEDWDDEDDEDEDDEDWDDDDDWGDDDEDDENN